MSLRVALFVEGSENPPDSRKIDPLEEIWNTHFVGALGINSFAYTVPISKKHLIAMDPNQPPMSGAGEGLDQLIVRILPRKPFDAAVVAWDLVPAWNPGVMGLCRWEETLQFYKLLSESNYLDSSWKHQASVRHQDLSQRVRPQARSGPPVLAEHSILALCMVPMFEELLVLDEGAAKSALGVVRRKLPSWPVGWGGGQSNHPDQLLAEAINMARSLKPPPSITKRIRGDMHNNKNGWGEYFLRTMLDDERVGEQMLQHPISARLAELMR